MRDVLTEASALNGVLESTAGIVGAVLATTAGKIHAVRGTVSDAERIATTATALADQLAAVGCTLGMGTLEVISAKAPSGTRVFARQGEAFLAIELDAKRMIGELEAKLRTQAWAPDPALFVAPPVARAEEPAAGIAAASPTRRTIPAVAPGSEAERARRRAAMPRTVPPPPGPEYDRARRRTAWPPPSPPPPAPAAPSTFASSSSGPVFTGDLDALCLPDLLEFLRNSQRSGCLLCTSEAGIGTVHLARGMIVSADSPHALDLRAHFAANPALDPECRRELASLPDECFQDHLLDGAVISRNLVPREEVERARVERIYSAFRELIGWTEGRFSFDPTVPVSRDLEHALSVQTILMRICQDQDGQDR